MIQSGLEEIICLLFPVGRGSESSRHVNKAVWENTQEEEEEVGRRRRRRGLMVEGCKLYKAITLYERSKTLGLRPSSLWKREGHTHTH